jgi:hypothetical protein
MQKKISLFYVLGALILFTACQNRTTLHLPERKESFPIYNYDIDEGCISFKRSPDAKKGETICNERFWIEESVSDD